MLASLNDVRRIIIIFSSINLFRLIRVLIHLNADKVCPYYLQ